MMMVHQSWFSIFLLSCEILGVRFALEIVPHDERAHDDILYSE